MELSVLALIFVFALAIGCLWLFANDTSQQDPQKPLRSHSLVGSFVAAQIGGSSLLYTAEYAYTDGIYAMLYPLGSALGLLALGLGIGAKINRLQLTSVPDLFEKYYRSGTLKKISCFLSMISLLGLLVAQAMALKDFFRALGIEHDTLFILAWTLIIGFTVRGALRTRAGTEIALAIVLISILSAACFFSPHSPTQGISLFGPFQGIKSEFLDGFHTKFAAYLLMPCFFVFLEPEMAQATLRLGSRRKISVAFVFSVIILLLASFIPVYYGIAGKAVGLGESTSGFMNTVRSATHPIVASLCACALLFALVSGSASLLHSINTHLTKDLIKSKESVASPRFLVTLSWGWTLLLGMVALFFSYTNYSIASLILESYELVVVCMLVPLVKAAFSRTDAGYTKLAAGLSMSFGALGFFLTRTVPITVFPEVFSIILSWIGFMLGKALASKIKPSLLSKLSIANLRNH